MALVKTKGLVIRERPFQEQDKIITLFTENEGKIKAIAKGVRRNRSPLVAATQHFAYSEFVYYPGKNFANINQADLIESFYPLRNNLVKLSLASYVLELIDAFYDDYQGNKAVLKLIIHILYYISEGKSKSNDALVVALQLKLSEVYGICPILTRCVICGKTEELTHFSIENNGALCKHCSQVEGYTYRVNNELIKQMIYLLVTPVKNIKDQPFDEVIITRIMDIMDHYITYHLERNLKTYDFYKEIKN
ncbi:MAG: DNA repair protein RecO [Eubacterium sp.]